MTQFMHIPPHAALLTPSIDTLYHVACHLRHAERIGWEKTFCELAHSIELGLSQVPWHVGEWICLVHESAVGHFKAVLYIYSCTLTPSVYSLVYTSLGRETLFTTQNNAF